MGEMLVEMDKELSLSPVNGFRINISEMSSHLALENYNKITISPAATVLLGDTPAHGMIAFRNIAK
jgi:hypothetical protein